MGLTPYDKPFVIAHHVGRNIIIDLEEVIGILRGQVLSGDVEILD